MTLAQPRDRPDIGDDTDPTNMPAPILWERSSRYADQPMSWRTRMVGIGGVAAVALVAIGGALLTWQSYHPPVAQATLTVFDTAPPAAPPEPARETPPGPEQVEKKLPVPMPETPPIKPPEIQLPSENVMPAPAPKPDPGPPVPQTSAPEARPAAPAPQVSSGKPTWEGLVLAALNKAKRYPREAQARRQQGVPYIRLVIDREGKVLSVRLERSSGVPSLDREALVLPKRAQPLPKPPADVTGDQIELVVPVEYFFAQN